MDIYSTGATLVNVKVDKKKRNTPFRLPVPMFYFRLTQEASNILPFPFYSLPSFLTKKQ